MKKITLFLVLIALLFSYCNTEDTVQMVVASERKISKDVTPVQEVFLVKERDAQEWSLFYNDIEGFDYEPGYEYVLEVREEKLDEPTMNNTRAIKYHLVKEISKTKKISKGIPQNINIENRLVWTGKVLEIQTTKVEDEASKKKYPVKIATVEVTALNGTNLPFDESEVIHVELLEDTKVKPVVGREYVFKAKRNHPAHALGVYMLETDVQDLI